MYYFNQTDGLFLILEVLLFLFIILFANINFWLHLFACVTG